MSRLEEKHVGQIMRFLSIVGAKAIRTHSPIPGRRIPYKAGTPDIIACFRGRCVALEVKSGRGSTSGDQDTEIAIWRRAGATTAVVRDVRDVAAALGIATGLAKEDDK